VLKDFDEALRGIKAGERTTAMVVFPEGYPTKGLAGKTAEFAMSAEAAGMDYDAMIGQIVEASLERYGK